MQPSTSGPENNNGGLLEEVQRAVAIFFHYSRYGAASTLIIEGVSLPVISTLMGHCDTKSMLIYQRVPSKESREGSDTTASFTI